MPVPLPSRAPDALPVPMVGVGLRAEHYRYVLSRRPAVPFYEVITENVMGPRGGSGGRPLEVLLRVREFSPVSLHGVSLNIGSVDPLDVDYLRRLRRLARVVDPLFVSDHLCWTGVEGENLHDLLPLPHTASTLRHVAARVSRAQDLLGRRLLIENVSSYLTYAEDDMSEWTFLAELSRRTGCGLLLDVNNVYVSSRNHGFDPEAYLKGLPKDRVMEMHLAGYSDEGDLLIDTHDHPVSGPVWRLYRSAIGRFGPVPTLVEWDERIPPFPTLWAEARKAAAVQRRAS